MFYSKGNNDFSLEQGTINGIDLPFWNFDVGDYNGDGQADLLAHQVFGAQSQIIYFHRNEIKHMVTSILNADHWINVETVPLPQDPDYTSSIAPSYPFNTVQLPIKVVKEVKDFYGITALGARSTYKYSGLEIERRGLGLRGFTTFTEEDHFAQITNKTTFDLEYFPTAMPVATEKRTFNNQLVSTTQLSYTNYNGGANGASHIVVPLSVATNDYMNNTTTADIYDYGAWTWLVSPISPVYLFGKPDMVTHSEGTDVTTVTHPVYNLNWPFYNYSKPAQVITTSTYANKPSYSRTMNYTYNASALLQSEQSDPSTTNEKTVTYSYDAFGNVIQKDLVAANINNTITDQYTYTSDGRFMATSLNPLQYQNTYTYNDWGAVLTHTTPDGLQTTYAYDQLNRQTIAHMPTGTEAYTAYDFAAGPYSLIHSRFMTTASNNVDNGFKITFFDHYDRPMRTAYTSFQDILYEDIAYYPNGLMQYKTAPYKYTAMPTVLTNYSYDDIGREISQSTTGGATITTSYVVMPFGLEVNTHNINTGQLKITRSSQSGKVTTVIDNGNVLNYDYHSNGKLASTTLVSTPLHITDYQYDNYGRLTQLTEPNAGITTYQYNALDELVSQTDANGITYTFIYDLLGRQLQKTGPEGTYTTTYNNTTNSPDVGKVNNVLSPNTSQVSYTYNGLGLLATQQQVIGNVNLQSQYLYDNSGRLEYIIYPSGNKIQHVYNNYGTMSELHLVAGPNINTPQKLWELTETNERGQLKKCEYNNGMYRIDKDYTPLGLPLHQYVTTGTQSVCRQLLNWNPMNGNLLQRTDLINGWQENFQYDNFDRLTDIAPYNTITNTGMPAVHMQYSAEGNVEKKTDITTSAHNWAYSHYALTRVPEPPLGPPTGPPIVIPLIDQDVTYTPFKKVATISEGINSMNFTYGPLAERWKAEYLTNNAVTKTKYYATNFERTVDAANNTSDINYIWAGGSLVAMLIDDNTGTHTYFTVTDHLGSITHILDDQGLVNNGLVEERSFDAWGRMRDPVSFQYFATAPAMLCDRGYTGHEHLNDFNIINMNGRLYDPFTGRMYSPDPVLTDNTNSQAYNKYAYALNNPLKYTDPSGNVVTLIGAAAVVVASAAVSAISAFYSGGNVPVAAAIGAGTALVSLGVGSLFTAGSAVAQAALSGAIAGGASGFVSGTASSLAAGNSWDQALISGLTSGIISAAISGVTAGLMQGLNNIENGKNVWSGEDLYFGTQAASQPVHVTQAGTIAAKKAYNGSPAAIQNDQKLADKVQSSGVQSYSTYTTQLPTNDNTYGLAPNGDIVRWSNNGTSVMGFDALTTSYNGTMYTFVSPKVVNTYTDPQFTGLFIHEGTHAYHLLNIANYSRLASEQAAYNAEAAYYNNHKFTKYYNEIRLEQAQLGFTGMPPKEYAIPASYLKIIGP